MSFLSDNQKAALFALLKQRSTWLGITGLLLYSSRAISAEHADAIATAGVVMSSMAAILMQEAGK